MFVQLSLIKFTFDFNRMLPFQIVTESSSETPTGCIQSPKVKELVDFYFYQMTVLSTPDPTICKFGVTMINNHGVNIPKKLISVPIRLRLGEKKEKKLGRGNKTDQL
jgi:hypothetical protein